MFYIQQQTQHDCGYTCLKMLLANLSHDENYLFLTKDNKDNDSLSDLINIASKYGLSIKGVEVNDKTTLSKKDKVPFIAILEIEGVSHAVYVYRIKKKMICYYDPAGEFKKLSKDKFYSLWNGKALIVDNYKIPKRKEVELDIIKIKEKALNYILVFLSGLTASLGIYFISKDSYFFLPLIFLTLMVVIELINKRYMVHLFSEMDKRLAYQYIDIKDKGYYLFFETSEKYKEVAIIDDINIYAATFIVIVISFIMLLNDKLNFIYIVANFLFAFIYFLFITPYFKKKEKGIKEMENKIKNSKSRNETDLYAMMSRTNAYQYGNRFNLFKYLFIFLQFSLAFVMMYSSNITNVTYVICYLMMEIYLYNNFSILFSYKEYKEKKNNLTLKLLSLMEKE